MDTQNDPGGISFKISWLNRFSSQEMLGSLRMLSLLGGDAVKNFDFEGKYVDIPTCVIGIDHVLIHNFVQDQTDQC